MDAGRHRDRPALDIDAANSSAAATWRSTSTASSRARSSSATACASAPTACVRNATHRRRHQARRLSQIEDTTMGQACVIGPYARTRPGTVLGADVHLGNFVEVKNSVIADHPRPTTGLRGRRRHRPAGQRRRRHHHLQLRRRQQVPHHHRGRRFHRLRHPARRAGARRPRRHPGRRHHAHQGRARRRSSPCPAPIRSKLSPAGSRPVKRQEA